MLAGGKRKNLLAFILRILPQEKERRDSLQVAMVLGRMRWFRIIIAFYTRKSTRKCRTIQAVTGSPGRLAKGTGSVRGKGIRTISALVSPVNTPTHPAQLHRI
jgi:hypothetical protein